MIIEANFTKNGAVHYKKDGEKITAKRLFTSIRGSSFEAAAVMKAAIYFGKLDTDTFRPTGKIFRVDSIRDCPKDDDFLENVRAFASGEVGISDETRAERCLFQGIVADDDLKFLKNEVFINDDAIRSGKIKIINQFGITYERPDLEHMLIAFVHVDNNFMIGDRCRIYGFYRKPADVKDNICKLKAAISYGDECFVFAKDTTLFNGGY